VEGTDRYETLAVLAAEPGLVEVGAVAARTARQIQADPEPGRNRLDFGSAADARREIGPGQRDRRVCDKGPPAVVVVAGYDAGSLPSRVHASSRLRTSLPAAGSDHSLRFMRPFGRNGSLWRRRRVVPEDVEAEVAVARRDVFDPVDLEHLHAPEVAAVVIDEATGFDELAVLDLGDAEPSGVVREVGEFRPLM